MVVYHCELCNSTFRDNHNLNRHLNRKKGCVPGNQAIVNDFGNENLTHLFPEMIKTQWKIINTIETEPYRCACKIIIKFHELVVINESNINICLKFKDPMASVLKDNVWSKMLTDDIVNDFVKIRSSQLLLLLNFSIKSDQNKLTKHHLGQFARYGTSHNDSYANTRNFKTSVKMAIK